MAKVNVHEAKTHLSKLVDQAGAGKEIIIAKAGKPVAKLVPLQEHRPPRKKGLLKGKIHIGDAFDAPLPPEVLSAFEGSRRR
jgi:prevent-host-death family protein